MKAARARKTVFPTTLDMNFRRMNLDNPPRPPIQCWRDVLAKTSIFASVSVQSDPPLAATLQARKLRAFGSTFFTNIELGGGGVDRKRRFWLSRVVALREVMLHFSARCPALVWEPRAE